MASTTLPKGTAETVRRYAVSNALTHDGKARVESVIGRLLSEHPELRSHAKELSKLVAETVKELNSLRLEQLRTMDSEAAQVPQEVRDEERRLPQLPNAEKYALIVTRFAPNPDGPLTFGNARAIILSHEYSTMYEGKFVLRFEDTDPKTKTPIPEAYDWIREDLKWLGADWQAEYFQSARLETYYTYSEKLIGESKAYVCTCNPQHFKNLVNASKPCPCRSRKAAIHLERWRKMLSGETPEGKAVVRIKTDLSHPNPAVRDWPALRIIDTLKYPHPLQDSKYRVWPLYNFSAAIDDHEMAITHILRAKEHVTNATRQEFLYAYMGWKYPDALHFGMVLFPGMRIHKSIIRKEIAEGRYLGWDDPRLTTLRALRRRGILPETIRRFMLEIGAKPVEAILSWDNLYAMNRKLLDPVSKRYSFVPKPLILTIKQLAGDFEGKIPYHVEKPELGFHGVHLAPSNGSAELTVSGSDIDLFAEGRIVRLMGLFNVQVTHAGKDGVEARFHSVATADAKRESAPIIHWVKSDEAVPLDVVMPDAGRIHGLGEKDCRELRAGEIVQFLRFGFVRVDKVGKAMECFFSHK